MNARPPSVISLDQRGLRPGQLQPEEPRPSARFIAPRFFAAKA